MKQKTKTAIGIFLAILSLIAVLFASCEKKVPNVAPVPDSEVQSSLDAVWGLLVATDIDMMCAYAGVDQQENTAFTEIEEQATTINKTIVRRNPFEERVSVVFNRTKCRDGRFRDGEVRLIYNPNNTLNLYANPNSNYYHEFGFGGLLNLNNYRVDSFMVSIPHPGHGFIVNQLPQVNSLINPSETPLKWEILSKFEIIHPSDLSGKQDIYLDVRLTKVLVNSGDINVYDPDAPIAILWDKAVIGYYGEITGRTGDNEWTLTIDESQKLIRDFTCSPDRVRGVQLDAGSSDLSPLNERHHPFVRGVATFRPSGKYPRVIYFGNESNVSLQWQCDNTGEVMIKGIAYKVNFRK